MRKPYCTVQDVESYLKITFSDEEKQFVEERLIPAGESTIEQYCRRTFAPSVEDETILADGGSGKTVLPVYPILSITSVEVNGSTVTDYEVEGGAGIIYSSRIVPGSRNVKVTGRFGLTVVPADISLACTRIVAEALKPRITEGFGVKVSWEQDSRVEFEKVMLNNPDIMATLKRWYRW